MVPINRLTGTLDIEHMSEEEGGGGGEGGCGGEEMYASLFAVDQDLAKQDTIETESR